MCAIAGMLSLRTDDEIREKMLKTMERRGPDDRGVYESEGCCLLHARLAIIDPQGGVQPMELKWNQEKYVLVYNGLDAPPRHVRGEAAPGVSALRAGRPAALPHV